LGETPKTALHQDGGVFVNHPESSALVCQMEGQLSLLPMNWG
jgi:hypothetical protein